VKALTGAGKIFEITKLLRAWSGGDDAALEELAPVVSAELHRIARRRMRSERQGHTLQTDELVNEAWLRLMAALPLNGRNARIFMRSPRRPCGGFWWTGSRQGHGAAGSGRLGWSALTGIR